MATKKPRISVTLEPEINDILTKYSDVVGVSKSSLINKMLIDSKQSILTLIKLAEQLKEAPDDIRESMIEKLQNEEKRLNNALEETNQLRLD